MTAEARLLTVDELRTLPECSVLWEEIQDEDYPEVEIKPYPVELECVRMKKLPNGETAEACIYSAGHDLIREYNVWFRLWTAKPTREQRKAAKWDG